LEARSDGPAGAGAARDSARALEAAAIDGRRRPETLEIAELVRLSDAIDRLLHP
jgi:hypothetical protein